MQAITTSDGAPPTDEAFHNCLYYFVQAIEVLAMESAAQCEAMGNVNVGWELQHDAMDLGAALVSWRGDYLAPIEKNAIEQLLAALAALPSGALSSLDNQAAMSHPAWIALRAAAAELLVELQYPIERTRNFFGQDIQGRSEKGPNDKGSEYNGSP